MMELRYEGEWAYIEACGLTIKIPMNELTTDPQIEIRCAGKRMFTFGHEGIGIASCWECDEGGDG